jgi:Domain of unknown function (DUF4276)
MNRQVIIGFSTEGSTDFRFLESIIQRTFEDVAFDCTGQIEVLPVQYIPKTSGTFIELVKNAALEGDKLGISVLCIHTDADAPEDTEVLKNKINPAFSEILASPEVICKNLVAIIPIQMTEAWMLADTELLKSEIGSSKQDSDLKLDRKPESIADPKMVIAEAIVIARSNLTKLRRRQLNVGELYQPIGQKIDLTKLKSLKSYQKFRDAVKNAYRALNYLA